MQHTRLALLFLASVAAGIITLVACDTDNGTVPLPGGGTSGTGTSGKSSSGSADDDTTGDDDTGPQPDDDDAGDAGGDADCRTAPKLRTTTNGFFCGFYDGGSSTPDSGGRANCGNTQACCNPGKDGTAFPPSFCADDDPKGDAPPACAAGAAGAGSTWVETGSSTWECASKENCNDGQKCCATSRPGSDAGNYVNVGPLTGTGAPPKQCNAKNLFKVYGSRCADDCKQDKSEIELCSGTSKCSKASATCVPVRATGNRDLGACQPYP